MMPEGRGTLMIPSLPAACARRAGGGPAPDDLSPHTARIRSRNPVRGIFTAVLALVVISGSAHLRGAGAVEPAESVCVAMYVGEGTDSAALISRLKTFGFPVREATVADLDSLKPGDCDVLYLPGGWYVFESRTKDAIRAFVNGGGGSVGTCAGAYNVGRRRQRPGGGRGVASRVRLGGVASRRSCAAGEDAIAARRCLPDPAQRGPVGRPTGSAREVGAGGGPRRHPR